MKVKFSKQRVTVNGVQASVLYCGGPWIEGVDPSTIKIRCRKGVFPAVFKEAFAIENNSDMRDDYFENDSIRLVKGDRYYEEVKKMVDA